MTIYYEFWFEYNSSCIRKLSNPGEEKMLVQYSDLPLSNQIIQELQEMDAEYLNFVSFSIDEKIAFYYKADALRIKVRSFLGDRDIIIDNIWRSFDSHPLINQQKETMYIFNFWFEHGGGCIWAKNKVASDTYAGGVGYVHYSKLPISQTFVTKLEELDNEYGTILDWACPQNPYLWSESEKIAFYYKANQVRVALQATLGKEFVFIDNICASLDLDSTFLIK